MLKIIFLHVLAMDIVCFYGKTSYSFSSKKDRDTFNQLIDQSTRSQTGSLGNGMNSTDGYTTATQGHWLGAQADQESFLEKNKIYLIIGILILLMVVGCVFVFLCVRYRQKLHSNDLGRMS